MLYVHSSNGTIVVDDTGAIVNKAPSDICTICGHPLDAMNDTIRAAHEKHAKP